LNFLFLGSSWMASAIGQHHIVPNLLEQKGYQVNTGFCFVPGQNFEGHIKNNMGLPTQSLSAFVKQARAEKWFTEEKYHMPTVCELSGTDYPNEYNGNKAVRHGSLKLISRFHYDVMEEGEWELYKLEDDRTETENLAGEFPEEIEKLEKLYIEWA